MIFRLTEELMFPNPRLAGESGLLAIGGDLSPERLMLAYANGIFPWYSDDEPICWYCPETRCVLLPQNIRISKSMQKVLNSGLFEITAGFAFPDVIAACKQKARAGQDGTWITDEMEKAYIELYELGYAISVEVWQAGKLVGGLYGVIIGRVFFGESMFSDVANASKAALIWLCRSGFFDLIDCQVVTSHLVSMGATAMPRNEFLNLLQEILDKDEQED